MSELEVHCIDSVKWGQWCIDNIPYSHIPSSMSVCSWMFSNWCTIYLLEISSPSVTLPVSRPWQIGTLLVRDSLLLIIKMAKCVMSTESQRRAPSSWTYLHTDYYQFSFGLVIATDVHDFQLSFKRAVNCLNYTTWIFSESSNDNKDSFLTS